MEYTFYIQNFWATCACPEKTELPWNFLLHTFRSFEQLALVLKSRVSLEFFTVLKYFLSFRIIEQHALTLKNRVALKFFTALNILFAIRSFEQLALALKSRGCPKFTVLNIYFSFSGVLSNLRLPWKTEFALKFFKPGGNPPDPPPRTPVVATPETTEARPSHLWGERSNRN